jgi:hypothetical protein
VWYAIVYFEREMLRREGIKWHVADLSGHARLNPAGTRVQSLTVGPTLASLITCS